MKDEGFEADMYIVHETRMYAYTVHCTIQTYQLDKVLQGLGKFLWLISCGLSNKVYKLDIYT
jgi:hypothetical protein